MSSEEGEQFKLFTHISVAGENSDYPLTDARRQLVYLKEMQLGSIAAGETVEVTRDDAKAERVDEDI